jgi:methylamine dehydrogenase light chain
MWALRAEGAAIMAKNVNDVPRTTDESDAVDGYVERLSRAFAQRTGTRQGFLALMSKTLLGLVGISSLSPLLPVDRRVPQADPSCSAWQYCNIYGIPCANCPGGSDTSCPSGCTQSSSYWVGCCYNPSIGCYRYIHYYDCCCSSSCSAQFCSNGGYEQAWCSPGYTCTLALNNIGNCSCIHSPS